MTAGTTGTVAILFTDLVGSTDLSTGLGDDAAHELRRTHFALLRGQVAATGGTEVKNLGDGLMVVFPKASDAVSCAVAMQQALARHNRRAPDVALNARIGVSVGEATNEDGDYFGVPVVEAARLCELADGGQVLCTDLVRALAAGRGTHEFRSLGPMTLRGLSEPVGASAVAWDPDDTGPLPLPHRMRTEYFVRYVGRTAEREVLADAWKHAKGGERRLVLIAGEPGIGKTRLATQFGLDAHAQGATVLFGRCDEDLGMPYQPFVEALGHFVSTARDDDLGEQLGGRATDLVRLVPQLADRLPGVKPRASADADSERFLLFDAMASFLSVASAANPIVLLLDDLQWATTPTLLMLKHLARAGPAMSVLVVGTYRDSDLSRGHPLTDLLADLRREHGVERLALRGLDDAEVVDYVEAAAGHELDDTGVALAHAVRRETAGSPFFVGEILRHLADVGAVSQRDGRWTVDADLDNLSIPESVREVIGRRLERLTPETNEVLRHAAVIGPEFDHAVLAPVTGLDEDVVLDALDEAVAGAVILEAPAVPGRFTFSHALIRHTLHDELGPTRRLHLHRRVAEVLEELAGPDGGHYVEQLAHHWFEAAPKAATAETAADKAILYSTRAAEAAMASLAYEEAGRHLERALLLIELDDRPALRCDLLIALADAQRCAGDASFRESLLSAAELARRLGDADRLARAAIGGFRGTFSLMGAVDEDKVAVLEAALAAQPPEDTAIKSRLLAVLAAELQFGDDVRRVEVSREAIAMARRVGDDDALAFAIMAGFWSLLGAGSGDERATMTRQLEGLAARLGDPELEFYVAFSRFSGCIEQVDMAGADAALATMVRVADDRREPRKQWRATYSRATRAMIAGRLAEAEELGAAALALGELANVTDAFGYYGTGFYATRYHQGRLPEVIDLAVDFAAQMPHIPQWRMLVAHGYTEIGRPAEAREVLDGLRDIDLATTSRNLGWLTGLCALAEACAVLGDTDLGARVADVLMPHRGQQVLTGTYWFGVVDYFLAQLLAALGRDDEADAAFASAVELLERLDATVGLVRARAAWNAWRAGSS